MGLMQWMGVGRHQPPAQHLFYAFLIIAQIIHSSSADCVITNPTALGKLGQLSCVHTEATDLHEKSLLEIWNLFKSGFPLSGVCDKD